MRVCFSVVAGLAVLLSISDGVARIVISEFRTRGPAGGNDEFIELYNAGEEPVAIGGYKIDGSNSSGYVSTRATIPAGTIMPPKSFYLIVNVASGGYSGSVPGDLTYSAGIADNGGIAIKTPDGQVVDAVGMSTGSAFYEGTPLSPTSVNQNQSYERKSESCGPDLDTDDNSNDFQLNVGSSNPQNSLSCRPACAGDPCVRYPECVDATTSRNYQGECVNDFCEFTPADTICEFGCDPSSGLCAPDPCEGIVCEAPPNPQCFEPEGVCENGECVYFPLAEETPCDDSDPCTEGDQCDGLGNCSGSPIFCYPPEPECIDVDTSRVYTDGACNQLTGVCEYNYQDTLCQYGCDPGTGLCANDPCAGIICNTPPNDQCYEGTGVCVGGTCVYSPLPEGTGCDDGDACTERDQCDGAGSCSGEPIVCNSPPNTQCYEVEGSCIAGSCVYTAYPPGSDCDDGDLCTEADVCTEAAVCVGVPKVCEPIPPECDEGASIVTLNPVCDPSDGLCRGNLIVVQCGSLGCDTVFGTCNRYPIISQFRTRGPQGGNDEFVEIFNPSAYDIDISGWTLRASNASGTVGIRATVPQGTVMGPRTFYLFVNTANNGYSGLVEGDVSYTTGITDDGGLALVDAQGNVVDAVGMSTGSAYLEGLPLTKTSSNLDQAYLRKTLACGPDWDFDNNAEDFDYVMEPTPRNSKSCRPACAGDPCVMVPKPWCEDDLTLVTYGLGECAEGNVCVYPSQKVTCDFGCQAGACAPDPCEGVVCLDPPNAQCYAPQGICIAGSCNYTMHYPGTPCDDGNLCTLADQCDATGLCGGVPVTCPVLAPECINENTSRSYSSGTCKPETGECEYAFVDTECEAGCNPETGLCFGDLCAGILCYTPPTQCYLPEGKCVNGECQYELLAAGTPCDDEDPCTLEDVCDGEGLCAGSPLVCDSPPVCHVGPGTCEAGECVYALAATGSECDDQDPCTLNDKCDSQGKCVGEPDPACVAQPDDAFAPDVGDDVPSELAPDVGLPDKGGVDLYDAFVPTQDVLEDALGDAAEQGDVPVARPQGGGCSGCSSAEPQAISWLGLLMLLIPAFARRRRS